MNTIWFVSADTYIILIVGSSHDTGNFYFCCCCSLPPHKLQHSGTPCPSPSLGACSTSCPLNRRHPIISFSVTSFSSCPQSFPASGSFPISWLFTSSGQSIGASASGKFLLMNIRNWFTLGLLVWSCSPRDSWESSPAPQFKSINSSVLSLFYGLTLTSVQDWMKNYSFVVKHCEWYTNTCVLIFNWRCIRKFISDRAGSKLFKARVRNLQNLMPDALRWSWCNSNRNKVHNKPNALESSWSHPHPVCGKIVFHEKGPWCQKACGSLL